MFRVCFLGVMSVFVTVPTVSAQGRKIPITGVASAELAPFDEMMLKFMAENQVPGAALAVAKDGKLVYARGFGYADAQLGLPVQPRTRFRIASISKPITAAMILRLIELGVLRMTDNPFEVLKIALPKGADPRLKKITIQDLLQHTAGWDRGVSFDPMFRPILIAKEQNVQPPARPIDIIHYMAKRKLDFTPGERYAYSNFGYSILGRVIEKTTDQSYEAAVKKHVLTPLGIKDTQLGQTQTPAKGETHYFDAKNALAVLGPERGKPVARPYGAWYLEAMDAHGGWISTAPDLVRFGSAFFPPDEGKVLTAASIKTMFARPDGLAGHTKDGKPKDVYYGCGWNVRHVAGGKINVWHNGALDGTATILVHRFDGLCWAVLFNTRANAKGTHLGSLIDPLVHQAANQVKRWPVREVVQ